VLLLVFEFSFVRCDEILFSVVNSFFDFLALFAFLGVFGLAATLVGEEAGGDAFVFDSSSSNVEDIRLSSDETVALPVLAFVLGFSDFLLLMGVDEPFTFLDTLTGESNVGESYLKNWALGILESPTLVGILLLLFKISFT